MEVRGQPHAAAPVRPTPDLKWTRGCVKSRRLSARESNLCRPAHSLINDEE
jgi:hypothetical protein